MREDRDFNYYIFKVGRYVCRNVDDKTFKPYKTINNKLVWNIFNKRGSKITVTNLFEYNWVFLWDGLLYAKRHYANDFNKFADHVQKWLQHEYWARCEYETVICKYPSNSYTQEDLDQLQSELNKKKEQDEKNGGSLKPSVNNQYPEPNYKIDVYTQVMINWDRFIEYVWSNKHLITKKKLGFTDKTK